MDWTEQQKEAITRRDSGLIVSAAAGSGKTSVLVERLLRILMDESPENKVPADHMIVVTFTNDAAAEMRSRLYQALDQKLQEQPENTWLYQQQIRLQNAHICTISSFCFELIRENLGDQGITAGFRILSETESKMMTSKAADVVLNQWHTDRAEDMQLLWNSFCEKDDTDLERLLLELHKFLGTVPFRENWVQQVQQELQKPLEDSAYYQMLSAGMEQNLQMILRLANEAADTASELYESVTDNKVLAWIEADVHMLEQTLRMVQQQESDAEKLLEPYAKLKQERTGKRFSSSKKGLLNEEALARAKSLREMYKGMIEDVALQIETIYPYTAEDLAQTAQLMPLLLELEEQISAEIWKEKVRQNALSFDDAERMALELLAVPQKDGRIFPSPLAEELQTYYQLIMIDEYQDSNNKQDDIFKLLSRNCIEPQTGALRYGENVFLVGDVKQSIYRFRLANPQNFSDAIASAGKPDSVCNPIVLNQNFRSVPAILNFVNFVCGNLMTGSCGDVTYNEAEALYAGSAISEILPKEQQKVCVAVLEPDKEYDVEMTYVVRKIRQMIAENAPVVQKDGTTRPCQYRDFCVLLRNNDTCAAYAHALEEAGIPVQSPEEKGYLKAREISILIDMLRVLDNPTLDTPLAAVMLSPMFWFTPEELMQIRMLAKKSKLFHAVQIAIGVAEESASEKLDSVLVEKCRHLYDTVQKLRQDSGMMTLESLIRRIYDTTDFLSVMQLAKDGERKRANLRLLLQYAKQYEENTDAFHGSVSGFLRYIDWLLENNDDFQQSSVSAGAENAVAVKTMHGSKGLEYPFVFLGNLEKAMKYRDGEKSALFSERGLAGFCVKDPTTYVRAKTVPFAVLCQEGENAYKSEELRLLYVAMTRAKQQLFLPLEWKKSYLGKSGCLTKCSAMILPEGKLPVYLVQSVSSMAQWIWMCLFLRHDAELADACNFPPQYWKTPAWSENLQIAYEFELPEETETEELQVEVTASPDEETLEELRRITAFQYVSPDCERESLLSVSAIQEARQNRAPVWKRPDFRQKEGRLTGAERGTATHTFFQYADFRKAEADVPAEIRRLQTYGFLTPEQAAVVKPEIPEAFFRDQLYQRLRRSRMVLREKKFLVQCRDLQAYPEAAAILHRYENSDSILKGIIDLAFQEEDGFVLVDYKTDTVSSSEELADSYREQLLLYRGALQCITGMPVRQCYLYSTHLQKSIEVKS